MALALLDEIEIESQRILDAKDNFTILNISQSDISQCTVMDIVRNYDAIAAILRRREVIRNPKAAKARAKLDAAKAQLANDKQLNIEKNKHQQTSYSSSSLTTDQILVLNRILNTTEMLERRAEAQRQSSCVLNN